MREKRAEQAGSAIIIAIVAIVAVAVAVIVFVIATSDEGQPVEPQPPEPEIVTPTDSGSSTTDLAFEKLQTSTSAPDLSWSEKADAWVDYLEEVGPTPDECQQLPPGDSSFFTAIQPALDRHDYSPDIRIFLEEMVAIATEHDILDNEWNDTPEAVEQGAQLIVRHMAELSPNDEGILLCLHGTPRPLRLPSGG